MDLYRWVLSGLLVLLSLVLAILVTLMVRALSRERTLKNYMVNQSDKKLWQESLRQIAARFAKSRREALMQTMVAAGFYDERYALFYYPVKYGLFALLTIGCWLFRYELDIADTEHLILVIASLAIVLIILPDVYLNSRKKELTRKISQQLPYLIDLLGVCVQTGMTIESAFHYLTVEMANFDKNIAFMLKKVNDRSKLVGLDVALEELLERIPSAEMHSFVQTLSQSLHYGTSIYQVLKILSQDIREIQMLSLEEKVGKLSAKMSVPLIVFIMIPVAVLVAAPGVMRLFYHGL